MRVIWAVSFLTEDFTFLQWKMLLASIRTWKKHHPGTTTVLYISSYAYSILKLLKWEKEWDEIHIDIESYLSGCYTSFTWDYPKVEALYQEKQKVLYVDYDIVFHGSINLDKNYQWCWAEESTYSECYWSPKQTPKELPPSIASKLKRTKIAYNTGMLYLDYDIVVAWRDLFKETVGKMGIRNPDTIFKDASKFTYTVGQGCLVPIVGNRPVKYVSWEFFDQVTHFIGMWKRHPETTEYKEFDKIVDTLVNLTPDDLKAWKLIQRGITKML